MNWIRGGAILVGCALVLVAGVARAQDVTGKVVGQVLDKDTGSPLAGITVIVQGPQGEDGTITDDRGNYYFSTLPVGKYVIRFYLANAATQVEQPNVIVSAQKTVRVNARIAGTAQAAAEQTYVITGKAPAVDIGSSRVGATFDEDFIKNVPVGRTFGEVIEKAPGAFVDRSGGVSIGGATGLENIYVVNGLNVTGLDYGNLENGSASLGGGSNVPVEFISQIDVHSGGYAAEFGGAMGGVVNVVTKSGTNELHGSAFGYWSPYWLSGEPKIVDRIGGSLASQRKPDFDTTIGAEVGGPLIRNKLFFWVGFAPRFENTHVFRLTRAQQDADGDGVPDTDAAGNPITEELRDWRARIPESRQTYYYATTIDWTPRPEHRLTLYVLGAPSRNKQMRSFNNVEHISNPDWARESLEKNKTDVTARWTSKLLDRRWVIEANAGLHREDYDEGPANSALKDLNQLEWWGSNLWDLERAPGCEPVTVGMNTFQPCPVDNYHNGGSGQVRTYTGKRWMAEIKSTNLFEGAGHHEVKYGYHLELNQLEQNRYYSGPLGARALIQNYPGASGHWSFFSLPAGEYPASFQTHPWDLSAANQPYYKDNLAASVENVSQAFFLQDSYSPKANLTFNVGGRLELQKVYDYRGDAFLDLTNFGPRISGIYDPTNDGRSKVFGHYGQYYEAMPLNLAARYFGGEGIAIRGPSIPPNECAQDPSSWTGNGEWRGCQVHTDPMVDAGNYSTFNNGANYPVQADIKGQFNHEIVAGLEREVIEDLTVGLTYTRRWVGNLIEDGTADGSLAFVLGNPGNVPDAAINQAKDAVAQREMDAMAATTDEDKARTAAALQDANVKLTNLQALQDAPKPERTYNALTLTVNKRFSRHWLAKASYTYSRLLGNYNGLYDADNNYFAPNGTNSYDTPDLNLNRRGALANDRPHLARLDGYYTRDIGKGSIVAGLGFSARSGQPRNHYSALAPGLQLIFLLPRGSGGRTPTVTQLDAKFGYRRQLSASTALEAFIDLYNVLNQQTTLVTDDDYTFSWTPPIVNGTTEDLKFAKDVFGSPIVPNPNYGRAVAFQSPFHARLGLRLTF